MTCEVVMKITEGEEHLKEKEEEDDEWGQDGWSNGCGGAGNG